MSYSVKTSHMVIHMAELQNIANEDAEAGKNTKGFPCTKVMSSSEGPETIRCGAEIRGKTKLCGDCHATYKAVEAGDFKETETNGFSGFWQRLVSYAKEHPKLAIGVGVGVGLALIGTVAGVSASASATPATAKALNASSPSTSNTSPTITLNVTPTQALNSCSTKATSTKATSTKATSAKPASTASTQASKTASAPNSKCNNGQVFLFKIEGSRGKLDGDFVKIKNGAQESMNLFRVSHKTATHVNQSCYFSLTNLYPANGTQIIFENQAAETISSKPLLFTQGQGAIELKSNGTKPSVNFTVNCDIPPEYKKNCTGIFAEDTYLQGGAIKDGFLKKV